MTSMLAWMDFSEAEQRRAREIVQLFTQRESRDELGIGVVRDVFSNWLFPGVSVVQTRARYLLFVPWIFQRAAHGRTGEQLLAWASRQERLLIEKLREGGDIEGLIGREAGIAIKTLPSVIYWSALQRYGILRQPATIEQVAAASSARPSTIDDAITERVDRLDHVWDPYLPAAPRGFPNLASMDFTLTSDESSWLRERITASCTGSLLDWMIRRRITPGPTDGPWDEPWSAELPDDLRRVVHHAELFSLTMHGAALLYNLLLAERSIEAGLGRGQVERDDFAARLESWQRLVQARAESIEVWDLNDFWTFVVSQHPGRTVLARRFIDAWIHVARSGNPLSPEARSLIAAREREQKGAQARLRNDRLLRQWGGSSGADRISFRWGQTRRMLNDLNVADTDDARA
jgi:hypothetical protein